MVGPNNCQVPVPFIVTPPAPVATPPWMLPCPAPVRVRLELEALKVTGVELATVSAVLSTTWVELVMLTMVVPTAMPAPDTVWPTASPAVLGTFSVVEALDAAVVETVVVKDKQGKPVEGLSADDFTLTEDGIPQKIRYCEYEVLPASPLPVPPTPAKEEDVKIYKRLARTQIAPGTKGVEEWWSVQKRAILWN